MEDCVIKCGGPVEPLEDTTETVGGTDAAGLTASVRTDLPPEDLTMTTTNSVQEQQQQLVGGGSLLLTTLPASQNGTAARNPTAAALVQNQPTESSGRERR
jgi:hypothetical protein